MTQDIAQAVATGSATRAERDAVAIRLVADRAEWDALVAACPVPHLPQGYAYGAGKAATGWTVRRAVFSIAGRPVAIATVLELRRFGLVILSRVNRGPLFLEAEPSAERIVAIYRALRRRWRRLLIAPALPAGEASRTALRRAGFWLRHERSWQSGRIDLTVGETALWAGFASTFRNRARQAEKAGAELRITADAQAYDWLLARHVENMSDKRFNAASPTLLRALRESDSREVLVFQLRHAGEPVAGMSVVSFGDVAEYHIGWFGPEGRRLNAGNFLMWAVMREMKRRGIKSFDVGGLKPGDGYTRFKQTMRPVEYMLAGEWMSW